MQDKKTGPHQSRRKLLLLGAAGIASSVFLTGCPLLFVGGTAMGVKTAMDRRSTKNQLEDQNIELKAMQALGSISGDSHINVTSYNRQVLITGEVPSAEKKSQVEQAITGIATVRNVVNELVVGPNTSISARSNDTYITSKVKTIITSVEGVSTSDVKVVTERSVVYLLGILTAREAQIAGDAAASVAGVKKVVRMFEIISEAQLQEFKSKTKTTEAQSIGSDGSKDVK